MRDSTFSDPDPRFVADSRLGTRLRQEAFEDRPTFSPSLHARIVQAVRNEPIPRGNTQGNNGLRLLRFQEPDGRRNLLSVSSGMVAATLLIGSVVWWFAADRRQAGDAPPAETAERQSAQDSAAPQPALAASPPEVLKTASSLPDIAIRQLQTTLGQAHDRRWAYLDHDAAVAKRLVAGQFPTGLAAADMP